MMIGELSIINEWISRADGTGTVFVLENAGEVGEKEDPYWRCSPALRRWHAGSDYAQADGGAAADDLRFRGVLGAVFYQG